MPRKPLTQEQLERKRKYEREYQRRKRAGMPPESKEKKPLTAEQLEKKRKEQLERKRKRNRESARRKTAALTPDEKDARRKKNRVAKREQTQRMTEEEKKIRRQKNNICTARYKASRTPAQKKVISQIEVARQRKKRASMTGVEYQKYLAHRRSVKQKWREQLTGAKLEQHMAKDRLRGQNYCDRRRKVKSKCPHCSVDLQQGSLKDHVKRIHDFCNTRMKPLTTEEREEIQRKTNHSTLAENWKTYRRGRITASRAHLIVRLVRGHPHKLVEGMMKATVRRMKIPALERGLKLEPVAVSKFMELQKIPRNEYEYPVGFCVHEEYSFIGATPDALIRRNACVEIKCPIVPVAKVAERKSSFLVKAKKGEEGGSFIYSAQPQKGHFKFNRKHEYFTQVVLQIMCTGRDNCHFVVYFQEDDNPEEWEMWMETITKKEATADWNQRIKPKLLSFYAKYLASEPIPNEQ